MGVDAANALIQIQFGHNPETDYVYIGIHPPLNDDQLDAISGYIEGADCYVRDEDGHLPYTEIGWDGHFSVHEVNRHHTGRKIGNLLCEDSDGNPVYSNLGVDSEPKILGPGVYLFRQQQ